ncbi:uncharacterized protein N7511_002253 [Penicillium nucicola]|uniref:uncharacterized protein n=1 Tax=Penicillium nucicola TaxID=1850975 RepID=UPI0025456CAE|nr:uncharacterized protein N7511_002253 [Penicillium nucicola]KAJ5770202.1 hypothetical protein N7511_002253 [Penicillium nucicola]
MFGTRAVRSGLPHDATGVLVEPICLATTFAQQGVGSPMGPYVYSRPSNPNREGYEKAVADLESANHALAFSSGRAATAAVIQGLSSKSHIVSMASMYSGNHRYLTQVALAFDVEVSFVEDIHTGLAPLLDKLGENVKLVWIETPSNPTLSLVDIQTVAKLAHQWGVLLVVDNTFLSPYIQNPLKHGADIVLHSATNNLSGHSDVLMGTVAFNSPEILETLSFIQNTAGSVPSRFDCWLAHRGLKTLHLRASAASHNALILAKALQASHHIISVDYPGLAEHAQRMLAICQHRNGLGGGMISFRIRGGLKAAERFCASARLFTLAESLGGLESLCEIPAIMTYKGMPEDVRGGAGIYDDLVRLSVGIEDADDLLQDLLAALENAALI